MDLFTKLSCIQISVAMLVYGCILARVTGAWSHPAVIWAIFWFALTFLPLIAIWPARIEPWAMIYILGAVIVFGLPVFCYDWTQSVMIAQSRGHSATLTQPRFLVCAFFFIQACTILCLIVDMTWQGYSLREFVMDPVRTSYRYLGARYSGTLKANFFSQTGTIINYIAAPLGGIVIARQRSILRVTLVLVFAFFPSLIQMIVYSDKGALFLVGAYFFAGILVARVMRGDTNLLNATTIKAGLAAAILLFPILVFAMLSRGGGDWDGSERITKVIFYLNTYAFGHLFAFSDWFANYFFEETSRYANPELPTLGFFTFLAIGRTIFPGYRLPPGIFDEYFSVPGVINTNIYTVFRPLIVDFGLIGSLVFVMFWGLVASLAYNGMLRQRSPALNQAFFILTIGSIYTSYIISLLIWNSIYAATFGLWILLIFGNALSRKETKMGQPSARVSA
jgi:oligosaccharide repeat unit polymerase